MPRHRTPRSSWAALALGVALIAALLAACATSAGDTNSSSDSRQLSVVAGFYPLQYVAQAVGGDAVTVTNLTKTGTEPHDLELTPQDVATLSKADLAVYLNDFQPAVDDAISSSDTPSLDVSDAANLSLTDSDGATDPHFWLDPLRLADVADAVASQLVELDPGAARTFERNAANLRRDLTELNATTKDGLRDCDSRLLVTSHAAFGYLADAYDLQQVGLTGLTPETEPTAADLAEVTDFVKANDVKTIFYETLVSSDVADTVAQATGASTAVLDPIEGLTDSSAGDDYLQVMDSDLDSLREGLGCR